MTEGLTVITERVDDIPVLLAHLIKMGLPELLDEHILVHGNWQGLSLGWPTTVWLGHILSEGDHRLNQVQPWAQQRLDTLRQSTGQALTALAWSDARLSDDQAWRNCETGLNQRTIRVYVPAIAQVRQGLGQGGLLYVGDSKMLALATRAFIQAGHDYYLGPLSKVHLSDDQLAAYLQPIWAKQVELIPVERARAGKPAELIAEGYELSVELTAAAEPAALTWVERRLVIRSVQSAQAGEVALQARLAKAEQALAEWTQPKQGKRRLTALEPLQPAAEAILKQARVETLLNLSDEEHLSERPVRQYRQRPAEVRIERQVQLHVSRNEAALAQALAQLGWRVYATHQPADQLCLAQAGLAYRQEYLIEHGFGRLNGKPLSLNPMYLQDDDRATGLVRLLTIGLRALTLLEFVVRRGLAQTQAHLTGLYAGNPKRATARPSAETLLLAFKNINLTVVAIGPQVHRHLPALSDLQQRILALLGFSADIFTNLRGNSSIPP